MLHSRKAARSKLFNMEGIQGQQHSAITLTRFQRGMDPTRHSDSGKTAGSAIENYKSSKGRSSGADAVWAVCPGHHVKDGNSAYW